jgi:hypothetical protein
MPAETTRLDEAREGTAPWKKWGPYLSERQWGTVREDYSDGGDAWNYFALALWNGKDAILKERLFGLTNSEGNHGEDVKEYYFYLDSTPTHSYMKYLYKYPQAAYPYDKLIATNRARSRHELEYELLDTGVFDEDRYFDVFVEYAKAAPDDILVQITIENRGRRPRRSTCCRRSGSATRGRGENTSPGRSSDRPVKAWSWPHIPSSGSVSSRAMAPPSSSSPRTTPTRSASSGPPTARPTSRTGSSITSCTASRRP